MPAAGKFLDKLSTQQPPDAAAIDDAIERLTGEPRPHGGTALKGYSHVWRIRVGNDRVCYQVHDRQLLTLVITLGTRNDVYEILQRHLRGQA